MKTDLLLTVVISALLASGAHGQPQTYTWLAIAGKAGNSDDGTNGAARFSNPTGIAVDTFSNIYVFDQGNFIVRKVTPRGTDWVVTTIAGLAGSPGSIDGTNSDARFGHINGQGWDPQGVAVDTAGNVYVADSLNSIIRKITLIGTNWVTTTIAGLAGAYGNLDGTNNDARFGYPAAIGVDGAGNLYVADPGDGIVPSVKEIDAIRKITPIETNWVTTTIAGRAGTVGYSDGLNMAATFGVPYGLAVDNNGKVFVADTGDGIVRQIVRIGTDWLTTTIAGNVRSQGTADGTNNAIQFQNPFGIAVDGYGNVYVADPFPGTIRKVTPVGADWVSSTIASHVNTRDVAADSVGNVYLTDGAVIRRLALVGMNWEAHTLAGGYGGNTGGTDGVGSAARFYYPRGLTADRRGNVFIADTENSSIRKLTHAGTSWVSSTIAGSPGNAGSADGANNSVQFSRPWGIAVDPSGNLYVADTDNGTIRTLKPDGTNWVSQTIGGSAGDFGSVDGTNSDIQFVAPEGIATGGGATVYVADTGNSTIRRLTLNGTDWVSSTIAGLAETTGSDDGTGSEARFDGPAGIALDGSGNLYVTDTGNFTIRKLTPVGTNWIVSTIAGLAGNPGSLDGTNSDARFGGPIPHAQLPGEYGGPQGIAVDGNGALYVADLFNFAIRKLTPVGTNWVTTTIGGLAGSYGSADGIGSNAQFWLPSGIASDSFGNVYVADTDNNTIREGLPLTLLQAVLQPEGMMNLNWSGVVGRMFQLQYSSDLASSNWMGVGNTIFATNAQVSTSVRVGSYGPGFYRVVVLP